MEKFLDGSAPAIMASKKRNEVDSLIKNRTEQFEYLRTNVRPSLSILVFNPIII